MIPFRDQAGGWRPQRLRAWWPACVFRPGFTNVTCRGRVGIQQRRTCRNEEGRITFRARRAMSQPAEKA